MTDASLKMEVIGLVEEAVEATDFCRDWRNRKIAHHDLKLALDQSATPLASASRLHVKNGLLALTAVINAVAKHFYQSEVRFDLSSRTGGARSLLYVLNDGVIARDERQRRFREGKPTAEDFQFAKLNL